MINEPMSFPTDSKADRYSRMHSTGRAVMGGGHNGRAHHQVRWPKIKAVPEYKAGMSASMSPKHPLS